MITELETRRKNIVYIRAILSLVIMVLGVINIQEIMESRQYVLYYLALLVISNFIFMNIAAEYYEGTRLHYIIFVLDTVFVTLGAYWLAYLDFLFLMMIFTVIFISAVGKSIKLSVLTALTVNIIYYYLKSKIPGAENDADMPLINAPFLFIVALHASYMAEKADEDVEGMKRLQKTNQLLSGKISDTNAEMENVLSFVSRVYDSFREGIIIMDADGVIRQFNRRCEAIFGIKRAKVINFLYKEVKALGAVTKELSDLRMKKVIAYEKDIEDNVNGETVRMTVNTMLIRDREENVIGYLCTLRPKTRISLLEDGEK